jgi:hypothetical protein
LSEKINLKKSATIDVKTLKNQKNIKNGPLNIDYTMLDNINFLEDFNNFKIRM